MQAAMDPSPRIQEQYEKAPLAKALIIADGSARAQCLFQTDQADRVTQEILYFLSAKRTTRCYPDGRGPVGAPMTV